MPAVSLVSSTAEHRAAFIEAEVAGYAEQQARDAGWPPETALERARAERAPVIERELEQASAGQAVWTAVDDAGEVVGWRWVTPPPPGLPPDSAFLNQITVRQERRRQGYGQSMLAALERRLAAAGVTSLYLHVNEANAPARRLYERAGYALVERYPNKRRLVKRLA